MDNTQRATSPHAVTVTFTLSSYELHATYSPMTNTEGGGWYIEHVSEAGARWTVAWIWQTEDAITYVKQYADASAENVEQPMRTAYRAAENSYDSWAVGEA